MDVNKITTGEYIELLRLYEELKKIDGLDVSDFLDVLTNNIPELITHYKIYVRENIIDDILDE